MTLHFLEILNLEGRGQLHILNLGKAPSTRSRGNSVFLSLQRETILEVCSAIAYPLGSHLESQPPQGTCLLQGAVWHAFSSSP